MRLHRFKHKLLTAWLLCLLVTSNCLAAELVVVDRRGAVRASAAVAHAGRVEVEIVDKDGTPFNGALVTLASKDASRPISVVSSQGFLVFDPVPSGVWRITTESLDTRFVRISISEALAPDAKR